MNSIHIVVKRLANILKYLEEKVFLVKFAPADNIVTTHCKGITSIPICFCKAHVAKSHTKPLPPPLY